MNQMEILLVEDNPEDVELTLRALKKNNIANAVHIVNDGQQALDFVFGRGKYEERDVNHHPRVILLDLKLPKVDGMEVLREIRNDERTRKIPVVMLTSSAEERDVIESYNLGVNSYIVKPLDFDQFINTVSHLGLYWVLLNKPCFS